MIRFVPLPALTLALLVGPPPTDHRGPGAPAGGDRLPTRATAPRAPKQRGVALGLFAEDVSFSYRGLLAEIAALGATHVALVVPLYQTHGGSVDLALHTRLSPKLGLLADTIREARRENLEVTVFPIVRLLAPRTPAEWRGTLAPADPAAWFRRYADVLGNLAGIASLTGASRLVVGSELSSLDGDLKHWRPLLARIRAIYTGRLVYSANWDHYRDARLFDLVDEDGVVAYFPLRSGAAAAGDAGALERSWRAVRTEIEQWRAGIGNPRPFIFTEVGYRSRAGSSAAPWDEGPGGGVDLGEQLSAFQAFRRAWAAAPILEGLYVWNWYGFGGERSTGYSPRGKPAAAEVKRLLDEL